MTYYDDCGEVEESVGKEVHEVEKCARREIEAQRCAGREGQEAK